MTGLLDCAFPVSLPSDVTPVTSCIILPETKNFSLDAKSLL